MKVLFLLSFLPIRVAPVQAQDAFQKDPLVPELPIRANQLIVIPPTDPGEYGVYSDFLTTIQMIYNIEEIHVVDRNPNAEDLNAALPGIDVRPLESHFWAEDLGESTTREICDAYRAAGYTAYLSHIFPTHQMEIGDIDKVPYGEVPDQSLTDPLMVNQVPWPFGEDDMSGYPYNGGGYLRARYALWPPDQPVQQEKKVLLVLSDTGFGWRFDDFAGLIWQNPSEDLDGDGIIVDQGNGEYAFDQKDLDGQDSGGNGYNDLIGYNFVDDREDPANNPGEVFSHGTSVYAVVGSETYNGKDMAGLLYPGYVEVVLTRVGENFGIYEAEAVEGIYYAAVLAAQGDYLVVLNMSWGGQQISEPLQEALDVFEALGGGAVASVGNDNNGLPRYPAAFSNVIAVSASTSMNTRASFSDFGSWCDIAAPGQDILSALWIPGLPNSEIDYQFMSGTSYSSPFVAGIAAMLWSTRNDLVWSEVKDALFNGLYTPEDYPWTPPGSHGNLHMIGDPPEEGNPYYGEGIIDAYLTLHQFN